MLLLIHLIFWHVLVENHSILVTYVCIIVYTLYIYIYIYIYIIYILQIKVILYTAIDHHNCCISK